MAHVKAGATTKGNRDSIGKRLGIKKYGGEKVIPGNIIVRQRGTKVRPGDGTKLGKDFTVYAIKEGIVKFKKNMKKLTVEVNQV
ncbi:50S ribosomal protein L27 [Candidatus Gottesmanbacteria bacterium CG11_big_fil_rev_8_21_14_0_20_37_11]|uniref:Large ribosomal subunit protein bL27 n=3 Tax=Candidatus Gottesmaniibacteriota TaxID=1752720 RepID=A0A2M7RTI6_9BACT|nr:MAG: 50S ribosomal protein L27 [Candidatus Gottesmanbacteria bacterium CG1_02_37_22]PIP32164.1 MAG: 50S ribosomal protein L27 [Candidatus Gottesmanbacteria bacterium CG23_combo_of_CG06-09_8_20_14_all_37_19]PIR08768.1 MAG: 50S ribosomal protein L27 [Candidatus Gottesmanbacteria bacterium CG11_big_fil_rev_8_21_14_0_20_37_11]PIZ03284.1 MAG: 50S ribosomal protein L27 [Candidatus Gottesmanbacteria bacterium CG_4_10_14_0_8_um_filter_37_24]